MWNRLPSARKIRRLNRRQRKKLRVGEFQQLVFEVRIRFHHPMDDATHDAFLDGFIALIESRQLAVGGMGGRLPILETDGIVSAWGRGSPSEADRQAVVDWLYRQPEVASAQAGDFIDGWYGHEVEQTSRDLEIAPSVHADFVQRGLAAIARSERDGDWLAAETVIAKLESKVAAAKALAKQQT